MNIRESLVGTQAARLESQSLCGALAGKKGRNKMGRKKRELPSVGGRRIDCTNAMFEHRCRVYLDHEQKKVAPDNGLIALLCDAVRLAREYNDSMQRSVVA